jgi:hypothetical protein
MRGFSVCQELLRRANGYTKCGPYLLASSFAAALLDRLFEHPEIIETVAPSEVCQWYLWVNRAFPQSASSR